MAKESLQYVSYELQCPTSQVDCFLFLSPSSRFTLQPLGWRSWNLYGANVDQDLIMSQMSAIVSRKRTVNGVPTSLADLGFKDVGYVIDLFHIIPLFCHIYEFESL
jgi:hypothetical protein